MNTKIFFFTIGIVIVLMGALIYAIKLDIKRLEQHHIDEPRYSYAYDCIREAEFHQAVREVLESLRVVIEENEEEYRKKLGEYYNIQGHVTVPQIIIEKKNIGGCDNLYKLNENGELDKLLKN